MNNTLTDRPRALGQLIAEGWRRVTSRLQPGSLMVLRLSGSAPRQLQIAPQDLRTGDPQRAKEFYSSTFHFATKTVDVGARSPFSVRPPSDDWERELHGFRWLRHLRAAGTAVSGSNARALTSDWIAIHGNRKNGPAWQVDVAARRLIAWLSHSVILVEDADHQFYKMFLRSIGAHILFLGRSANEAPAGLPRLQAMIALAMASLSVSDQTSLIKAARTQLGRELARQILPDGGHQSRQPAVLIEILADLLPLRQAYERVGTAPPEELISAIDRMMPMVRFFRHRDGNFARFNGTSATERDLMATILRYDDALGEPAENAGHSNFQRLTAGGTTVIMDTGKPAENELSAMAHAGCLSFEMSSVNTCFIANCGVPRFADSQTIAAGRSTAAHSTLVLNDTSFCKFHSGGVFNRYLGDRVLSGPTQVDVERREDAEGVSIVAAHNGYVRQFGIWHERTLRLSADGNSISGIDRVYETGGMKPLGMRRDECALRFHIHPRIKASVSADKTSVLLVANRRLAWKFTCADAPASLEESIFFASAAGPRRTSQIVVRAHIARTDRLRWKLERHVGTRPMADDGDEPAERLPLGTANQA